MSGTPFGFLSTLADGHFIFPLPMQTLSNKLIICAAMMALHGTAFAGGEGWTSDYAAAKKQAAASKKDLLIDFTGSDWCGWCIKLNDEVFKLEPFKAGVKDTFVLVELDFPKDKAKLTEAIRKQNAELGEKYAVQGYPSILLCDAEGRPYAATGYQEGGPEKYVTHLNELRTAKTKRDEAFAAAGKAEGPAKAKALMAALDAMKLDDQIVLNFYGEVVEQIKAADPKDESGFGKMGATKKRLATFQDALQALAGKQDMDGALVLVDKTLKEGGFDSEQTLQLMMTRSVIFAQQGKFDEALKALDEAKAFAPKSPMIPGIDGFRKRLEEGKKKAADTPAKEPAKGAPKEDAKPAAAK
jgi:thioredoxin-related protein